MRSTLADLDYYRGPRPADLISAGRCVRLTVSFFAHRDIVWDASGREKMAELAAESARNMFDHLKTQNLEL